MLNIIMQNTDPEDYVDRFVKQVDLSGYESVFKFPESLGNFVSTGVTAHDQFESTLDGDPVVLTYNNFTINSGHLVTVSNRCKGLYLNILGDLVVNGTLSMTARGASCPGKCVIIDKQSPGVYYYGTTIAELMGTEWYSSAPDRYTMIPPIGGVSVLPTVAVQYPVISANGACGVGGATGGSEVYTSFISVLGGNGTSFSGGAGAGGGVCYHINGQTYHHFAVGYAGSPDGGAGGAGGASRGVQPGYGGGGGAGNPGGICPKQSTRNGESGTGGLIVLYVAGNVIFGETGKIQSNGSRGGDGQHKSGTNYPDWPGGGSGGGAIHLFHRKEINAPEKVIAKGGLGGEGKYTLPAGSGRYAVACPGGDGTINIIKI